MISMAAAMMGEDFTMRDVERHARPSSHDHRHYRRFRAAVFVAGVAMASEHIARDTLREVCRHSLLCSSFSYLPRDSPVISVESGRFSAIPAEKYRRADKMATECLSRASRARLRHARRLLSVGEHKAASFTGRSLA